MNNAQGDSEFVEQAFTAEDVGEGDSAGVSCKGGGACAFLDVSEIPPIRHRPRQPS